jgi:hypothetical protein
LETTPARHRSVSARPGLHLVVFMLLTACWAQSVTATTGGANAEAGAKSAVSVKAGRSVDESPLFWVIDRDLNEFVVMPTGIDDEWLSFRARAGVVQKMRRSDILALVRVQDSDRLPQWAIPDPEYDKWEIPVVDDPLPDEPGIGQGGNQPGAGLAEPPEGESEGGPNARRGPRPHPWVELVDGQRWSGQLLLMRANPARRTGGPDRSQPPARPTRDPDSPSHVPTWMSDFSGSTQLQLDLVRRIKVWPFADEPPLLDPDLDEGDLVVLRNGDRIEGFVSEIAPAPSSSSSGQPSTRSVVPGVVRVESLETGEITEVGLDLVASISLLNPPTPVSDGLYVWLHDAEILLLEHVLIEDGNQARLSFGGSGRSFYEGLTSIRGILFDPTAFLALADADIVQVSSSGLLTEAEPPIVLSTMPVSNGRIPSAGMPCGLADVLIRGPLEVIYQLPDGASRFATTAAVAREALRWADFDLVIELAEAGDESAAEGPSGANATGSFADRQELVRVALNAKEDSHEIAFDIPRDHLAGRGDGDGDSGPNGRYLIIRIEDTGLGPIQDFALLRHPRIRIDRNR